MISRSSPAPWGRMVFGLLFVFALIAPISLWIFAARSSDPARVLNLFRVWSVALALLMVWSAVYIRDEPRLARSVLCLAILVFAFITVRVRTFSTHGGSTPIADEPTQPSQSAQPSSSAQPAQSVQPVKSGKNQKVATVTKSDKVEEAIVGKWQLSDGKGTNLFLKDKTFSTVTDDGHTIYGRYFFLGPNRLQFFFFNGSSDTPFLYDDIVIKDDTLSRSGQTKRITYRRLETYEDSAGVTGLWTSTDGSSFIIFTDGTFAFGRNVVGTWEGEGGHVVARTTNTENAVSWDLKVSSDGHTLSGPWQAPNGEKGTATFTRPKFDKLANYIIGRWQMAGHLQTHEYKKDGTVVITSDDGGSKTFNYSVADANHIQVSVPNTTLKLPLWSVIMVDDNVLTNATTATGQPATYVRLY